MSQYIPDLLVILLYFGVIIGIGLAQRGKSESMEGFALGDREIAWWAVLASIIAAEFSAATFLGAPADGYELRNWTYVQLAIGTVIARIIVSFLFIPLYYKQGVVSIYEFLENRFGWLTRKFASLTFLITRVLAMGTRLYVSAIILVLGFELLTEAKATEMQKFYLFAGAIVVITLFTALYTTVGGIRAVIWTDFIQVGVMVSALFFSVWFLISQIPGGWSAIGAHIREPVFWDTGHPSPEGASGLRAWLAGIFTEEYTIWAAFIASTFVTMATHGIDQDTVQRMLTAKNRKQSAFATILSGVIDIPIVSMFVFIGVLLSVYYSTRPEVLLPKEGREVFPFFILHTMPTGLRGLVAAGILATAMGSLSTALNALATSFSRDFVLPVMGEVTEARRVWVLRFSTVLFAVFIIIVGVWTAWYMAHNPKARILPLVLGILGFTFGSLLGIFLLGIFTKRRGNDGGNIFAMCVGFAAVFFLSTTSWLFDWLSPLPESGEYVKRVLAFPWRITFGCFVTVAVAALFPTRRAASPPPVPDQVAA